MSLTLWPFFHKGEKQNGSHFSTYCKACVNHHKLVLEAIEQERLGGQELDPAEQLVTTERIFKEGMFSLHFIFACPVIITQHKACDRNGKTGGEKSVFIAHILGSRAASACQYATSEATKRSYCHVESI
jgi:hypothetical protein